MGSVKISEIEKIAFIIDRDEIEKAGLYKEHREFINSMTKNLNNDKKMKWTLYLMREAILDGKKKKTLH